jgi:GTP-binding protein Era
MMEEKAFCSGFVTVVGRPNVGKSSLVNALVGQKVAIVSPKPQTTRRRIQAVLTTPAAQVVFLDTPGIQRPRDLLGQALVQAAREAMEGVDAVLIVADAVRRRGEEDRAAVGMLKEATAPVLLAVSKLDLAPEPAEEAVARVVRELDYRGPALGTSVVTGAGLPAVRDWIMEILGPGPKYFPDGVLSDQPQEMLVAELIREQALLQLADEVPHEIAVNVEEITPRPTGVHYIRAAIVVGRESLKGIVIGANGRRLKEIGCGARTEIEKVLGGPIYLDLWVRVIKGWRDSVARLKEFGYESC